MLIKEQKKKIQITHLSSLNMQCYFTFDYNFCTWTLFSCIYLCYC